jgi:hypothetical protein
MYSCSSLTNWRRAKQCKHAHQHGSGRRLLIVGHALSCIEMRTDSPRMCLHSRTTMRTFLERQLVRRIH